MKSVKAFFFSVLAGAAIGLGGLLFVISNAYVGKELGSLLFAVGLFLVCSLGLNLYTGKIGFAFENHTKIYALDLFVMLIGNTIGAYLFGLIARVTPLSEIEEISNTINKVVAARDVFNNETFYHALLSSFMCGALVFLAVFSFKKIKNYPLKTIALVFCVFLFVYFGFEHVIANIFYFSFGNAIGWAFVLNAFICLIGNSLGALAVYGITKIAKRS
ncbi:MAG: formate/nitrite transporter family protein [Bacilli bacterium]|nr:formate/nitrite transporter family protein [Bacilli bacterium]